MKARNKRYAAILSVVTVLALALSLVAVPVPSFAASSVKQSAFPDVKPTDPYANAFNALAAVGVYQGDQNGNANPTQQITRAEFAAVAVRLAGKASVADALQNQTPGFKDASKIPSWAWGSVNAASALGIIKGYPDGTFRATDNVTEAEAAAMIIRVLGDDGAAQAGLWPASYMSVAQTLGLLNGISNASANLPATRADVAFMAYNALLATKKWDSSTSSFDRDYAGLPIYYTDNNGVPQLRTQLTTYGEAQGVMTEVGSFSPSALALADTVYAANTLSALQNQDVYAFRAFGATAYSALTTSGSTRVVSGTITGFSPASATLNGYISLGGNVYPVTNSTTYTLNTTGISQAELANVPDGITSGKYSATVTLNSNGTATNVGIMRYNLSGFLTQATPAASSPDTVDEIRVATFSNAAGSGLYNVTGATILLNGQSATISDVQTALSNFAGANGGQAPAVQVATTYDASSHAFAVAPTANVAVGVKVSTNTVSGQITGLGSDSSGSYVVLSGQSNPVYLGGLLSLSSVQIGQTVTLLLNASGTAVATLQSSAQASDFYAMLTAINTTTSGSTTTNTVTLTMGNGSKTTYTVDSSVNSQTVQGWANSWLGEPVYVHLNSNGYVSSVQSYTSGTPHTDLVAGVGSGYIRLRNAGTYVFAAAPLIFDSADSSYANQLPLASVIVRQPVTVYVNNAGQVGVVILETTVQSLSASSSTVSIAAGSSDSTVTVTAHFTDGTQTDVTGLASYTSSNTAVATASVSGDTLTISVPAGVSSGSSATITASYAGKSTTITVNVP